MEPTADPNEIALRIAERLGERLQMTLDPARIVGERLYMRDVLLVCDAHRGDELAALSAAFRAAIEAQVALRAARRSGARADTAAAGPDGIPGEAPAPPTERRWFRR